MEKRDNRSPMNSSNNSAEASTEILTGREAAKFARAFRGMWPQPVADEKGYLVALAQIFAFKPREQIEAICRPSSGFTRIHKFPPSLADIQEWISPRNKFEPAEPEYSPGPNFTQERLAREADTARLQGPAEPEEVRLAKRKAFVIRELGYDPIKKRVEAPCFIPPPPSVDISDFPDGSATVANWEGPGPQVPPSGKPVDPKPWHDKEELARSRDRIAAYMASDKYLFKDRQP